MSTKDPVSSAHGHVRCANPFSVVDIQLAPRSAAMETDVVRIARYKGFQNFKEVSKYVRVRVSKIESIFIPNCLWYITSMKIITVFFSITYILGNRLFIVPRHDYDI